MQGFDPSPEFAQARDAQDPLAELAAEFLRPAEDGRPLRYFCGHSLGLMPRAASAAVEIELERWAQRGVDGHFDADGGWFAYHERFAQPLASLVGARPAEVVAMNSLTVNLHLMLVSFFRPAGERRRILIERGAFPSDRYAVQSQLRAHGLDPERDLVELEAGPQGFLEPAGLAALLADRGQQIALVLLPGVAFLTGQSLDLPAYTRIAQAHGCRIGFDLAHAIGNVPLALHEAGPDFAVWCSYKYLNGGPGAIGGAFVHERWHSAEGLPRFEGWWGHDKSRRFAVDSPFHAIATAEAWQLSNPPVLAMAPLTASLALFERAGAAALRAKSVDLTAYLEALLLHSLGDELELLTPTTAADRGAQLSIALRRPQGDGRALLAALRRRDVVADWREPNVLRLAPVPLYNSYSDVHAAVQALERSLAR
jgi:kynureninase